MARIVITRPNGETEHAELTTDKALAGNDRLTVEKDGTVYYAKLDSGVSTHMYVIKPDGRKLYVQKAIDTLVTFNYISNGEGSNFDFKLLTPKPQTVNGVVLHSIQKNIPGVDTKISLLLNAHWTGTITVELRDMRAIFVYKDYYSATCDIGNRGIQTITEYAADTPFKITVVPG